MDHRLLIAGDVALMLASADIDRGEVIVPPEQRFAPPVEVVMHGPFATDAYSPFASRNRHERRASAARKGKR